ncbi:hypothetical protein BKA70DRAFT_1313396, partial [Coprinopsis sp. MPI-PUGE-AT-0042]
MECTVSWCLANRQTLSFRDDVPVLTRKGGGGSCRCPSNIQGDPDIAGLGVIIARTVERHGVASFNPVDRWFRRACNPTRRFVGLCGLDPASLADALYDTVVSLSDQQIAQGIAILGSAAIRTYNSTSPTPLSSYHLATIGNLAWLSSNTNLLAILVVRSYSDSSKPSSPDRHDPTRKRTSSRVTRALRAIFMLSLAALLLWSSWLGGDARFYDFAPCPAACLVTSESGKGGEPRSWMIFNFFYVFYNYTTLLTTVISRRARVWWMDHVSLSIHPREDMPPKPVPILDEWGQWLKARWVHWSKSNKTSNKWIAKAWPLINRLGGTAFRHAKGIGWLLWMKEASEAISFLELTVYFALGVYWTVSDWVQGHKQMEDQGRGETTWGFGQLVPLFLLLIPFFQLVDSYSVNLEQRRREEEEKVPSIP